MCLMCLMYTYLIVVFLRLFIYLFQRMYVYVCVHFTYAESTLEIILTQFARNSKCNPNVKGAKSDR